MKDIYELFNEVNIDFSDAEEVEVSEIERERGKRKLMGSLKRRKSNKKKISVAIASLALISIVSVTLENPTWAANIPIIGDLMQSSLINVNKEYSDYINTIGQTKSHEGIDVTFENAVADNNMFTFSFTVKNNNAEIENPEVLFIPISLNINGKDINMSGGFECKVIDKYTVKYLWKIPWEYKELPKDLNVNIDIPSMFDKSGDFGVKFKMNTKDIIKNTYVEKLTKKFNAGGIDFGLDEITISPLSTNIKYHAESDEYIHMDFLVLDQDGNEVKFTDGSDKDKDCEGGERGKIKFSWNYINNGNVEQLKLIPRYHNKNYIEKKIDGKKIDLENFVPFEYKLTDNMSIHIENFTVDGENLIVKYNYEYLGKIVEKGCTTKDLGIKADGTSLEQIQDDDLYEKYKCKDEKVNIYKIGKAKDIEVEFYDGTANELLEDEAFTVVKK